MRDSKNAAGPDARGAGGQGSRASGPPAPRARLAALLYKCSWAARRNRRRQLPQVVHPVVRLETGQFFGIPVAIADRADFDPRAPAGVHVGGAVADEEAVLRLGVERG